LRFEFVLVHMRCLSVPGARLFGSMRFKRGGQGRNSFRFWHSPSGRELIRKERRFKEERLTCAVW
jgi:hypothetical protein